MENLNAEQIKRGLEHCTATSYKCEECPYFYKSEGIKSSMEILMTDALALINSQEQRIKELGEELAKCYTDKAKLTEENAYIKHIELEAMRSVANSYKMHNEKFAEENERLRDNLDRTEKALITVDKAHNDLLTDTFRIEAEAKADTVQKYREKLYREFAYLGAKDKFNKEFFLTTADQIAKEMLEGKDEIRD